MYHWYRCTDGRSAVQQRERVGVGKAERDVEIPPPPQVVDRVVSKRAGRLFSHVDGERLASGHVEQSLHVAEVAIDRGGLHLGGGAHRSRGYRAASAGRQQFGGGAQYE